MIARHEVMCLVSDDIRQTWSPMNEPLSEEQPSVAANVSTKHTSRVTVVL